MKAVLVLRRAVRRSREPGGKEALKREERDASENLLDNCTIQEGIASCELGRAGSASLAVVATLKETQGNSRLYRGAGAYPDIQFIRTRNCRPKQRLIEIIFTLDWRERLKRYCLTCWVFLGSEFDDHGRWIHECVGVVSICVFAGLSYWDFSNLKDRCKYDIIRSSYCENTCAKLA